MNKLIVISSYPPKGKIHYSKTVGVGSYAKNTLLGIKNTRPNVDILVLGDKHEGEINTYNEAGIKVKSVWKRGSFSLFPKILVAILRNFSYKHVLVEFEVSIFGNPEKTAPLPFLNFILRMLGKNVTTVIHQAITDMSEFEGHTNIKGLRSSLLQLAVNLFYSLLIKSSNKVIVFEQALKDRLSDRAKIKVIPHGIQRMEAISKDQARKSLKIDSGKRVVLVFGYLAWYKGTDWIIDAFKNLQNQKRFEDYLLIIAGGANPNRMDRKFYRDYVKQIAKNSRTENIIYTDFVDEKEITTYYSASDIILLPYRAFMSASGPLSFAYSLKKPVFVSSSLEAIFQTQDIKQIIAGLSLSKDDLTFDLSEDSLKSILNKLKDETLISKVIKLSEEITKQRGFKQIGNEYLKIIFNK